MLVALFAEPLQRRYEAPRWSCAHLFAILTTILAIVLPFFLCYPSSWEGGSIWLKQDKYREQPDVQYLYKFVVRLQLTDKLGVPKEIFYSTMNSANAVRMDSVRMAAVKSIEIDDDLDGLMDRFRLTSLIPLELGEAVYGLQALAIFRYQLKSRVKIEMESMAYISQDSGLPLSSLTTRGDVIFRQKFPIEIKETPSILYDNEKILDEKDTSSFKQDVLDISKIVMERYTKRDFAAEYQPRYVSSTKALLSSSLSMPVSNASEQHYFNLTMIIDVPTQEVCFIPTFSDVIKDAWIKYLSLFFLICILLRQLCSVVYSNQIVTTKVYVDVDMDHTRPMKY